MTDEQIQQMVNRFLSWKLPEDFHPDAGIKFEPEYNVEYMAKQGKPPMRHEPTGTNLFNVTQAEAMVRHMLEGLGAEKPEEVDYSDDWMNPPENVTPKLRTASYPRFLIQRERRISHHPFTRWDMWRVFGSEEERNAEFESLAAQHPNWRLRKVDELREPLSYN